MFKDFTQKSFGDCLHNNIHYGLQLVGDHDTVDIAHKINMSDIKVVEALAL